jgi:signal transduction histidine kinase
VDVVGTTSVRGCCTFVWVQDARTPRRTVSVRPYHCAACVGEMVRSAKLQQIAISGSTSMERVRDILSRRKPELVDRWDRQLRAASEAGFALDPGTAQVLPQLLEATDRALERRFRAIPAGAVSASVDGHRAATQSSLLSDFLFDSVLERLPEMNAAEQRLLSDALAHGSVEVLVRMTVEREQEKRRRDSARLAQLAHELRESMTAARLSLDLLQRRGALPDSKVARTLDRSLARLRTGIEDSLLDEVLASGGLRFSRVPLAPVLADARSQAEQLGKGVQIVVHKPSRRLHVTADPRLVRPAVRGLLRAALEVARPGSVVRVGADGDRERARVAVTIEDCRKLPGNRMPDLPALSFARRTARAHGGALVTRVSRGDGCEFRFELPTARVKLQGH